MRRYSATARLAIWMGLVAQGECRRRRCVVARTLHRGLRELEAEWIHLFAGVAEREQIGWT